MNNRRSGLSTPAIGTLATVVVGVVIVVIAVLLFSLISGAVRKNMAAQAPAKVQEWSSLCTNKPGTNQPMYYSVYEGNYKYHQDQWDYYKSINGDGIHPIANDLVFPYPNTADLITACKGHQEMLAQVNATDPGDIDVRVGFYNTATLHITTINNQVGGQNMQEVYDLAVRALDRTILAKKEVSDAQISVRDANYNLSWNYISYDQVKLNDAQSDLNEAEEYLRQAWYALQTGAWETALTNSASAITSASSAEKNSSTPEPPKPQPVVVVQSDETEEEDEQEQLPEIFTSSGEEENSEPAEDPFFNDAPAAQVTASVEEDNDGPAVQETAAPDTSNFFEDGPADQEDELEEDRHDDGEEVEEQETTTEDPFFDDGPAEQDE